MHSFSCRWPGVIAVAACTAGAVAQAQQAQPQFVAPPNALSFEDGDCTLELYRSGYMQIRTSKQESWVLKILPQTVVTVDGEAEVDYLRPGLSVELSGTIDRKSILEKPISEIELINERGRPSLGLFPADEEGDNVRPLRNPGPGTYRIKGKVAAHKDGQLTVSIGGRRITGTLADDVAITFSSDDLAIAETGDKVSVKVWYFNNTKPVPAMAIPGKALAEEISITLAKPLAPKSRRSRR